MVAGEYALFQWHNRRNDNYFVSCLCIYNSGGCVWQNCWGKWCTSKSARLISSLSKKGLHILHLNVSTFSFCEKTCMPAKTKEWIQKRAEAHDLHKCTLTSCDEMSSLISRLYVWYVNIFNWDLIINSPLIIIEKTKDFCNGVFFFKLMYFMSPLYFLQQEDTVHWSVQLTRSLCK